jgi:hypothetical protein
MLDTDKESLEITGLPGGRVVVTGGRVVVTGGRVVVTGGRVVVTGGRVVVSRRGDSIREPVAGSKVTFH